MLKKRFIDLLQEFAAQEGWTYKSYGDGWISEFSKGERSFVIHGYTFPLNNASSFTLAKDKAGTSELLGFHGISCVPHRLIFGEAVATEWYGMTGDVVAQQLDKRLAEFGEDLVLKPNLGLSGNGVVHTTTREEALAHLRSVFPAQRDYAVSPFVANASEIRVIMLDGEVLVTFEKKTQEDWRHNLAHGAVAIPVEDTELEMRCIALAQDACKALDLRLASVDIFVTGNALQIIEVNSGVMVEKMAEQLPDGERIGREIYQKIFLACTSLLT